MPRVAKELSALAVKNISHSGKSGNPERYAVGGVSGLMIQVTSNGAKSWLLRTTIADKRHFLGLGSYPEIGLKDAREKAALEKQKIKDGIDPIAERKANKARLKQQRLDAVTFSELLEEFYSAKLEGKSEKSQNQWRSTLENYAVPVIGELLIEEIDKSHILRILEPIWTVKTETARRLRGRLETVFDFALGKDYRKNPKNPARWAGNLEAILPEPSKIQKVQNQPAVPIESISEWYSTLRGLDGISARALEFLCLTACRSGEVRGMLWKEINLAEKVWIIPAERMKMRREHRVPLCDRAIQILEEIPRFEGSAFVFPAAKGGMLSDMTLSKRMKQMHEREVKAGREGWLDKHSGRPAVPHGLRASYRQWAGEKTDYPREIVELCLAHDLMGSVERAYMRTDILEKRREIMDAWSGFLQGGK